LGFQTAQPEVIFKGYLLERHGRKRLVLTLNFGVLARHQHNRTQNNSGKKFNESHGLIIGC
jgi:hypothetical protein